MKQSDKGFDTSPRPPKQGAKQMDGPPEDKAMRPRENKGVKKGKDAEADN